MAFNNSHPYHPCSVRSVRIKYPSSWLSRILYWSKPNSLSRCAGLVTLISIIQSNSQSTLTPRQKLIEISYRVVLYEYISTINFLVNLTKCVCKNLLASKMLSSSKGGSRIEQYSQNAQSKMESLVVILCHSTPRKKNTENII